MQRLQTIEHDRLFKELLSTFFLEFLVLFFPTLRNDLNSVQLNCLNWRDFLRHPNPVASALMAKMSIAPSDRPKVKRECLRMLATLRLDPAKMQLISGFIDTYLRLNAEEERIFQAEISTIEPSVGEFRRSIVRF